MKLQIPDAAPRETIELGDSDDEVHLSACARESLTPRRPLNVPSRSPHSTTSRHSGRSPNRASQPVSEFLTTSDMMVPKRAKPRRRGANGHDTGRRVSYSEMPFIGAGTQPQEQASATYDSSMESSETSRSLILRSHEQGVNREPLKNKVQRSTGLTSNHFKPEDPEMRINETTATDSIGQEHGRTAREQVGSKGPRKNLREFRHAEHTSEDLDNPIQGSEDELSQPAPNTSKPRRRQNPAIGPTKRNVRPSQSYKLEYARSYDFGHESLQYSLEPTENPKIFKILGHTNDGRRTTLKMLNLASINRFVSDNTHSIRLTGPATNGEVYWCDLKFPVFNEFIQFYNTNVKPEVAQARQSGVSRSVNSHSKRHCR